MCKNVLNHDSVIMLVIGFSQCHTTYLILLHLLHNWVTKGRVCPCPSLENIVMEDEMLVMFCSTHIGGLGQLHAQI